LFFFGLCIVVTGVAAVVVLLLNRAPVEEKKDEQQKEEGRQLNLDYYQFADYKLTDLDVTPNVKSYTVKSDLSNVFYTKEATAEYPSYAAIEQELGSALRTQIAKEWFVITPGEHKEFFPLYENNRYNYTPNLITTDAVMHTYHLMFDYILKGMEEDYLYDGAMALAKDMVQVSLDQYDEFEDVEFQNAAKRNVGFFSVAAKQFDPSFNVPDIVKTEVQTELDRIQAHARILVSEVLAIGYDDPDELLNTMEDYTQYIPRGHYTKSEKLKKYFKGMMWFGRMTFLAKDKSTTQSALLMVDAFIQDETLFNAWEKIYSPINFFVGKADDLTYFDYSTVWNETAEGKTLAELTDSEFETLWAEIKKLDPPQINSIPIFDETLHPDRDEVITGFRFMGQRFTVDAMIFQRFMYRDIKETAEGHRKMLPSFIEIPAAMGDDTALNVIKTNRDYFIYPNYEEQMNNLRDLIKSYDTDKWTQNLYWSWIYTLNSVVGDTPEGYPDFMQNEKWQKKELNTYAGSWTELKHDTILYAKQAYAELGGAGGDGTVPDDRGYVEPNITLWNRLLALVNMTRDGLVERGILEEVTPDDYGYGCSYDDIYKRQAYCNLSHMADTVTQLLDISVKELQEEVLTDDEHDFIRFMGGELEAMFMATLDPGSDRFAAVDDNPAMLVADVATDPNGAALEEGTGYIYHIYAIVPVDGELRIVKGGVYSQYEFIAPIGGRLTNEQWREKLSTGDIPEMTKWQSSIISE